MRRIALILLLAIITMAGSAPTWARGVASVEDVSAALAAKTAQLLAAHQPKTENNTLRAPIQTLSAETTLACVNHTLAANGLTEVTARHMLPGTTIRVETGTTSSSPIEYRLVRGDTVWSSCVKELKAVPALTEQLAQIRQAKALTAVWKSIARPPPLGAATEASTAALAAETATTHLLTKKAASLTTALAAETTKNHFLTEKVAQLQTALAAETASAQLLGRQIAELKQVHKPIDPPTLPATSSEGNQRGWGDLVALWAIYIGLGGIFLILAIFFIGVAVRHIKRPLEKKSPLTTGVTPITASRTPDPATPAQKSYPGKDSVIYYQIHPAWISGEKDSYPVYVPATVTEEIVRGDLIVLKGHAPWNYGLDDPREGESVELALFNQRTKKITYVTKHVAGQLSRALNHQYNRSPTTLRVHDWLKKVERDNWMLRVPRSKWARRWTSVIRGRARFDLGQPQPNPASS